MSPSLAALRLQCTPRQTFSNWLRRKDSRAFPIANCQLPICARNKVSNAADQSEIGNHKSEMFLVDLARFERASSTFAESRSDSAELQVRKNCELRISDFGFGCVDLNENLTPN